MVRWEVCPRLRVKLTGRAEHGMLTYGLVVAAATRWSKSRQRFGARSA